jgi:hypothetical protein
MPLTAKDKRNCVTPTRPRRASDSGPPPLASKETRQAASLRPIARNDIVATRKRRASP